MEPRRELANNTVGRLEEAGLASWTSNGAVDKTEWVNQLRTSSTIGSPYQIQESVHANYWGQMAMRAACASPTTAARRAAATASARPRG